MRSTITVALVALALAGCGAEPERRSSATTSPVPSEVAMHLIAYRPESLQVDSPATVTWVQHDAGAHTVTSGTVEVGESGAITTRPDGVIASGHIAQDARFTFTFDRPGTVPYFCEIHPATMRGWIHVR